MVTNAVAFGVEALQDAQRAVVTVEREGAVAVAAVIDLEMAVPGHGMSG
jgi:hypothetical protein